MTQFVKESKLETSLTVGLLRYWPITNSVKALILSGDVFANYSESMEEFLLFIKLKNERHTCIICNLLGTRQ